MLAKFMSRTGVYSYIRVLDYHVEESWGSARKKAL